MTDADFSVIQKRAYAISGITLSPHKKSMIYGRLSRRLRKLGLHTFREYCEIISDEQSPEILEFVNSITTNLTSFFRENHHFEYLISTVFPALVKLKAHEKRVRIWSAGCSTGEEPYSIAACVKSFAPFRNWDVKILATDLDSNVVATASKGVYGSARIEKIPSEYEPFFVRSKVSDSVKVRDDTRRLVKFNQLNLLKAWPMKGKFDVIFCRNVVIYFDADTQKKLFDRYADVLQPNAHLFIGHSENLNKISDRFQPMGRTVYQKIK